MITVQVIELFSLLLAQADQYIAALRMEAYNKAVLACAAFGMTPEKAAILAKLRKELDIPDRVAAQGTVPERADAES